MQRGFSVLILLVMILAVLALCAGGYYAGEHGLFIQFTVSPTPTPPQNLVGNDRDAHGCIGSAGYTWCEIKNKCLRSWEEPCAVATVTAGVTIDETAALKTAVKEALVAKHGPDANSLTVSVSAIEGNYAKGMASAQAGGGMWFAAKLSGAWKLVWDGNGVILCTDLTNYPDFPKTMIPECFDDKAQKTVKR